MPKGTGSSYADGVVTVNTGPLSTDKSMKVIRKVAVDGVVKFTSDPLTGTSATVPVSVDVTGGQTLSMQITDGGDGVTSDHGDWADAKLTCGP